MDNRTADVRIYVGDLWKRLSKADREQLTIEAGRIGERIQRLASYEKRALDFEYPFMGLRSYDVEDES